MLIEELGTKENKVGGKFGEEVGEGQLVEECKQMPQENYLSRNAKRATGFDELGIASAE